MAKLTAWLVTLIGISLTLSAMGANPLESYSGWIVGLSFLIIGISKLMRNYKM